MPPLTHVSPEEFLQGIADRRDWAQYYESSDLVSEEGRSLPYMHLSNNGESYSEEGKLRIWLQGGVHGNEPAGDEAILAVLGHLDANETWAASVLDKVEILALPRYNPDGVAYFQRRLATGYDPNRDNTVLQRQQTRDVKKLLAEFDPHIILDAHEYGPNRPVGPDRRWIKAQDVQFSASKSINLHKDISEMSDGMFTNAVFAAVESHGLRTGPYFLTPSSGNDTVLLADSTSAASTSRNSHALLQSITFLSETRGIGIADENFHRRVASALIVAETIIQLAVDNTELIYDTVENARREVAEGVEEVVVLDAPRITDSTMVFIDGENGSVVSVPVQYNNNTNPNIVLSRPRPEAYIFSGAWHDVAERLRVLGVEVEELDEDWSGSVEALTIETVELAEDRYEGIVETTVTTSSHTRDVKFPKGAYRVSTKQKNVGYAFITLEPETLTSYVRYNVIKVEEGDEYPVFRIP